MCRIIGWLSGLELLMDTLSPYAIGPAQEVGSNIIIGLSIRSTPIISCTRFSGIFMIQRNLQYCALEDLYD